jgi:PIN domain nuclease of toxin-antitoxin system
MKLLVDSHTLIWHAEADNRLPERASEELENQENEIFVSMVTFWELSIKESLGKLKLDGGVERIYRDWIVSGAAVRLDIEWFHLAGLSNLPWIHRDPFDRILISQALGSKLCLLTFDPEVIKYPGLQLFS